MSRSIVHRAITGPLAALAFLGFALLAARSAGADEGLWTLDHPPLPLLQSRYGFVPPAGWLEHVRLGAVRVGDASGSFVSRDGLVITNHHVAIGQLQKMSTPRRDYVRDGFVARTRADETPCPDLELDQLVSLEDVTARVVGAVDPRASGAAQAAQRRQAIARIEQESARSTGLRGDVVELYQGGEYWLYRYRKYTDVRLVMAPEVQAANFGGDYDNFSYPRYALDVAFLRVYDGGKPLDSSRFYFPWNAAGPRDSDLVFAVGNPGTTQRLETVAQLEFRRDTEFPAVLASRASRIAALRAYAARGPEPARRANALILDYANSIKARAGTLEGLRDPAWMRAAAERESAFRAEVAAQPRLDSLARGAWERIAETERLYAPRFRTRLLRRAYSWELSRLVDIATTIVRYAAETPKPNDQRLEEYRDSNLESVRFELFSPAPVDSDLEEVAIAEELDEALRGLGPDDPWVRAALGGRSPAERAHALVAGTKLFDPAERRRLIAGGRAAVARSDDAMIGWALAIDGPYREIRSWYEDHVASVEAAEGHRIARARFAAFGRTVYPDATGTLRLSYGRVAGYEQNTTRVPWKTTIGGLFARADEFEGRPPFDLAPAIAAHRAQLDPRAPLDFVCTDDIVGGNSGSPVLDRDARFVGIAFDGNIQSLVLDFAYTEAQARCVAVHAGAILEFLRHVYGATALADELEGAAAPK
ncbi:MAG TPA: S46 family peptidase [Terriglobales bacterium]|nr:S46 family peptidase [Terriglobales bacterium]